MWLFEFFRKLKELLLARPRIFRIDGGEIAIRNLSSERGDQIVEYLKKIDLVKPSNTAELIELSESVKVEENLHIDTCEEKTLGLCKNSSGHWLLVGVKYNPDNKKAYVDEVKNYGKDKNVAVSDFKITLFKLGII